MAPPAHSASGGFDRSARELFVGYGEVNTEVQLPQRTRFPPLPGEVVDWNRGGSDHLPRRLLSATPCSFRGPTAGMARSQAAIGRGGYSAIDQAAIGRAPELYPIELVWNTLVARLRNVPLQEIRAIGLQLNRNTSCRILLIKKWRSTLGTVTSNRC